MRILTIWCGLWCSHLYWEATYHNYNILVINNTGALYTTIPHNTLKSCILVDICQHIFQQTVAILLGTNCALLLILILKPTKKEKTTEDNVLKRPNNECDSADQLAVVVIPVLFSHIHEKDHAISHKSTQLHCLLDMCPLWYNGRLLPLHFDWQCTQLTSKVTFCGRSNTKSKEI